MFLKHKVSSLIFYAFFIEFSHFFTFLTCMLLLWQKMVWIHSAMFDLMFLWHSIQFLALLVSIWIFLSIFSHFFRIFSHFFIFIDFACFCYDRYWYVYILECSIYWILKIPYSFQTYWWVFWIIFRIFCLFWLSMLLLWQILVCIHPWMLDPPLHWHFI